VDNKHFSLEKSKGTPGDCDAVAAATQGHSLTKLYQPHHHLQSRLLVTRDVTRLKTKHAMSPVAMLLRRCHPTHATVLGMGKRCTQPLPAKRIHSSQRPCSRVRILVHPICMSRNVFRDEQLTRCCWLHKIDPQPYLSYCHGMASTSASPRVL